MPSETIPGLVDGPARGPKMVLAHCAGGSSRSPFLAGFADAMGQRGFRVARFDFPYAEAGRRAPDRAPVLLERWRQAAKQFGGREPVLAGKSMGGRYATLLMAGEAPPSARAVVLLGYPLH